MNLPHFEWAGPEQTGLLEEWDRFLVDSPRGHYCALSTWLLSFRAYGLTTLVLLAREKAGGPVIGGAGCLTFGARGFLGVAAPIAPVVGVGFEELSDAVLGECIRKARTSGAFLFQLQPPASADPCQLPFLTEAAVSRTLPLTDGIPFSVATAPSQMLWVDFNRAAGEGESWNDSMLASFNTNTRRNIRNAGKAQLQIAEARSEAEVQAAFGVIEQNGKDQGYATRTWREFGATLNAQVRLGQAHVLTAWFRDKLVGAHYSVWAGRRSSYLMGGTERIDEDPGIGHYLHWNAMLQARAAGLLGYDLTTSGPPGVLRFKMGFRPDLIKLQPAQYRVIAPLRYRLFRSVFPFVRKHKRTVANLLRRISPQ